MEIQLLICYFFFFSLFFFLCFLSCPSFLSFFLSFLALSSSPTQMQTLLERKKQLDAMSENLRLLQSQAAGRDDTASRVCCSFDLFLFCFCSIVFRFFFQKLKISVFFFFVCLFFFFCCCCCCCCCCFFFCFFFFFCLCVYCEIQVLTI